MPSSTKKQAQFMSALDHGWTPTGMDHPPSRAVAHEFHEADKRQGKFEHADGGRILKSALDAIRESLPNAREKLARSGSQMTDLGHDPYNSADAAAKRAAQAAEADKLMYGIINPDQGWARGGMANLPHPRMPTLDQPKPSPLNSLIRGGSSSIGHQMGFQHATARMPRIPIADTLRNIDAKVKGAKEKLPKLKVKAGGRAKFDAGGKVTLAMNAIKTLKDALGHLANKDASSAAATLRASPAAMAHPDVAAAANALRASTGIVPAQKTLTDLVNAHTNANLVGPTFGRGGRVS